MVISALGELGAVLQHEKVGKSKYTGYQSVATNTGDSSAAINAGSLSVATNTGDSSVAINTGSRSAAINTGSLSAATNTGESSASINTGSRSTAINTGYKSASINTGYKSAAINTGYEGIACALGIQSRARAEKGWIVIADWRQDNNYTWHIHGIYTAKVGEELKGIKVEPEKHYWFENGELKSETIEILCTERGGVK